MEVQKRPSKILSKLKDLSNAERHKIWGIKSLEERSTRGDLIQTYKTANGIESIDWFSGLQLVSDSRTGASMSHSKRLNREVFLSKACYGLLVNVRHEFILKRGTWH